MFNKVLYSSLIILTVLFMNCWVLTFVFGLLSLDNTLAVFFGLFLVLLTIWLDVLFGKKIYDVFYKIEEDEQDEKTE